MKAVTIISALLTLALLQGCGGGTPDSKDQAAAPKSSEGSTMDKVMKGAEETMDKAATAAAPMVEEAESMAAGAMEEVEGLIDQIKQYLSEDKMDLAGAALEKLKGMEASLPESLRGQIPMLEQMFQAKQATQVAMPIETPEVAIPAPSE